MIGRRLATLLALLLVVTLGGFGVAIQNVRVAQAENSRQVLELTQVVSLSPCSNLDARACLRKLLEASRPGDLVRLRELLELPTACRPEGC